MRQPAQNAPSPATDFSGALRTVFNILEAWQVPAAQGQRLLGVSRPTYFRWKRAPEKAQLDDNHLERLSYLLGIWKALKILLPDPEAANSWIRRPNDAPLFGSASPLERLAAGQVADLYEVRRWLDANRG